VGEDGARADALQAVDADVADGEAAVAPGGRGGVVRGRLGGRDAERGLRIDRFLGPGCGGRDGRGEGKDKQAAGRGTRHQVGSRKSTRLNSSHVKISYAVFCLQKKK